MIVKVRNSQALRDLARSYRYRRHDVILYDRAEVELQGGFWNGGSKSTYSLYTPGRPIESLRYPTTPPQFGGGNPPTYEIPAGSYVVESGIFRGKTAHLSIFGRDAISKFGGGAA